ncbi:Adenine DNA glycosylase like protein [Argiope bruennichi]|uniref:Adenine DNA glycosylase n=2 Tax=Argiope bruennichi TaxID=94029 RepID=A0A8T0FVM5_ARGBR|nr:Adenine DNA glycosylase like protein [Argiope bruennichi]
MEGKKDLRNKKASPSSKDILKSNMCDKHKFTEDDCQEIQRRLLKWYDEEQRTLPWRTIAKTEVDQNVRGYAVWVSEVMLQQTQVATVIPYFNKWMEKWPTVQALAKANVEEVLQAWAGLGYYSRGRRLHEGAKIIVEKLNGQIPNTVPNLIKLIPGIGPYSASAIASIAFQKSVGVVDGNVIRVLSRMRVIGAPVSEANVRDHLWELANKLVSKERPMDFNQALMELGATICMPQNPNCTTCTVNDYCKAYCMTKTAPKIGKMDSFLKKKSVESVDYKKEECVIDIENVIGCNFCLPSSVWNDNPQVIAFPCKAEKKAARQENVGVLVIEKGDQFLMVRRPEKGLLAGLWEFPCAILPDVTTSIERSQIIESAVKELGVPSSTLSCKKFVGEVIHLFSHIHATYVVEHLVLDSSVKIKSSKKEVMWVTLEEIKTAAVSTAMKKVLALVKKLETKPVKQVAKKKRKHSPENHKQVSIKSFFV